MKHNMTDLSSERLDELAHWLPDDYPSLPVHPDTYAAEITYGDLFILIGMARAKQDAERERDALREQAGRAGMKVEALASECTRLELERDALLDAITHADLDSVAEVLRDVIIGDSCEEDCGCVIHGLDRLRAVFDRALAQPTDAAADEPTDAGVPSEHINLNSKPRCIGCNRTEDELHAPDCPHINGTMQPTDAGGA